MKILKIRLVLAFNSSVPQDVTDIIKTRSKVKGLGRNSSYLAGFPFFFFQGSMKKFNQLAKKKNDLKFFSLA